MFSEPRTETSPWLANRSVAGVLSQLAQQISYTAVDEWNFYFFLLNQKSSDQCVRLHRSVIASGVGNFGFFRVVVYCDVTCGVKSK